MKRNFFIKPILILILVFFPLMMVRALIVPFVVVEGVILTGKILGTIGPIFSGSLALAKSETARTTIQEMKNTVSDQIHVVDLKMEDVKREIRNAKTEEETRRAYDKESILRDEKLRLSRLLVGIDKEKLVVREELLSTAWDLAEGYVVGEVASGLLSDAIKARYDNIQKYSRIASGIDTGGGVITPWTIYEVSEIAGETIDDLVGGMVTALTALQEVSGEYMSEDAFADLSSRQKEFYKEMVQGKVSKIKAAITDASWDYFVNVAAKQQFKDYLKGQSDSFRDLPQAIQDKYIKKFIMLTPSDIDEIHDIMTEARKTGNYQEAIEEITKKNPGYKEFFKDLTKDLLGSSKELEKKIESGLAKKMEEQRGILDQAEEEAKIIQKTSDTDTTTSTDQQRPLDAQEAWEEDMPALEKRYLEYWETKKLGNYCVCGETGSASNYYSRSGCESFCAAGGNLRDGPVSYNDHYTCTRNCQDQCQSWCVISKKIK